MTCVLAIDPGSRKCGLAVVSSERILHKNIVSRDGITEAVLDNLAAHSIDVIVLGNGTGSETLRSTLQSASFCVPIDLVEESFSTLRARARYFKENRPRGIRRLIPIGLLTPPGPYDDYVAVILAEEYLRSHPK